MLWHTVENEKFTLTKIFSRQINSLVIYLVNTVNTVLMAAALIQFDENFAQDLLSKS